MTDRLNKTSICSIVFFDIIDYSKKPVSEQIEDKTFFNSLINDAIQNIPTNDRVILDTGDGAAITLMGAPEEALFIAMSVRDGILERNKTHAQQILVRIGINLGSIRVMKDLNDRPNIIGDGINVAQRIMSFANENQILVSRSYYEVTSRLTKEITNMFTYSGIKQDKHIREHEVYVIKSKAEEEDAELDAVSGNGFDSASGVSYTKWPMLLSVVMVGIFVTVAAWYILIFRPIPSADKPAVGISALNNSAINNSIVQSASKNKPALSPVNDIKVEAAEKEAAARPADHAKPKHSIVKADQQSIAHHDAKSETLKVKPERKMVLQSDSHSTNHGCSQAQIAMNQCR